LEALLASASILFYSIRLNLNELLIMDTD